MTNTYSEFLAHIQATFPGLRRWINISRNRETGITMITFYDMDVRDDGPPVYVVGIHPRDLLLAEMTIPATTLEENNKMRDGTLPPGFITANY